MTDKTFEIDARPDGVNSKVVVDGQDVTGRIRGAAVYLAAGERTVLELQPANGYAGRILGEGVVLETTQGVSARDLLDSFEPDELQAAIGKVWETVDGSKLNTGQAVLYVLRARVDEIENDRDAREVEIT